MSQRTATKRRAGKRRGIDALREAESIFADAVRQHQAGRIHASIEAYERVLLLNPDFAEAHNNLGVALAALGRVDDAAAHYERAVALRPEYAQAHNNLGIALTALGRIAAAAAHYERAVALKPDFAEAHNNLGVALAALGRTEEAAAEYARALALKPDFSDAHNNLGSSLAARGDLDAAMAHYLRVLAIHPEHPQVHHNLGSICKIQGQFEEAMAHYGRAIAIRPFNAEAHFNRAEIKTFHEGDRDLAALEALAGGDRVPAKEMPFIHFALAKAFEDCGDYGGAFEQLRRGNDLKRKQIQYDEAAYLKYFQRISAVFNQRLFDRFERQGDPSPTPIFVLGMPRSGSTLVEQILASHPQIQGAGELTDLEDAARTVLNDGKRAIPYPESVLDLDGATLRRIGEAYVTRLPEAAPGETRIVDKLPGNFLNIGLIRIILPNARIIHTMRNPMDTCVSCYSRLFASGQPYSYDLAELGRYFRAYSELMAHWRGVLPPGVMLEVSYEDMVDDLERQARRLIAYCGLPWDDRCISFHATSRPVKTASVAQVRKPLFRSSLQRWRKYEAGLAPLLHELSCMS